MNSNLLHAVHLRPIPAHLADQYPFNIPAVRGSTEIVFDAPVTFLVGENGSGKSTLLEAIAVQAGAYNVGAEELQRDESLTAVQALADYLQLIWSVRTRKGFFLRAEDFFGYVKRLAQMEAELAAELRRVDEEYSERPEQARQLARMPFASELHALHRQYGRNLNNYSHGESFLELFQSRLQPGGLYLLDEPEAPLSPMRQLTLISMLKQMAAQKCQFIIATHSPMLMAFPGATILSFDETPVRPVPFETLEHVTITRSFLNNPEQYLRYL